MGQEVSVTILTTEAGMVQIRDEKWNAKLTWSWWEFCDLFQWNLGLITGFLKMSIEERMLLM